jgi:small subunit ribosomal protein S17
MSGKTFIGVVKSDKMQKTLVVSVDRKYKERRTGKIVSTRKKYKIHCEDNSKVKTGDTVSFTECRPISKEKSFRLVEVLKKAQVFASESALG